MTPSQIDAASVNRSRRNIFCDDDADEYAQIIRFTIPTTLTCHFFPVYQKKILPGHDTRHKTQNVNLSRKILTEIIF
jgi:hypothetical protein